MFIPNGVYGVYIFYCYIFVVKNFQQLLLAKRQCSAQKCSKVFYILRKTRFFTFYFSFFMNRHFRVLPKAHSLLTGLFMFHICCPIANMHVAADAAANFMVTLNLSQWASVTAAAAVAVAVAAIGKFLFRSTLALSP